MKWGIVFASTAFPEPDRAVAMATGGRGGRVRVAVVPGARRRAVGDRTSRRTAGSLDGKMDRLWRRGGHPRPAHLAGVRGRAHDDDPTRHERRDRPRAPARGAGQDGGDARRPVGRPAACSASASASCPRSTAPSGWSSPTAGGGWTSTIEAMRALWKRGGRRRTTASYVELRRASGATPGPPRGTIPLHIGGASPAAIRRAATYGDGYFPYVGPRLDLARELRRVIGRRRRRGRAAGSRPDDDRDDGRRRPHRAEDASAMAELGVDRSSIAVRGRRSCPAACRRRAGRSAAR